MLIAALLVAVLTGQPPLRWGGDAEGGAPFVEADPRDPAKLHGFDVEVAEEIARGLGRQAQFVQVSFSSIDQSVARGDFDDFALQFAQRVVILADGAVVEEGLPSDVLKNPKHPATRLLLQRVHEGEV